MFGLYNLIQFVHTCILCTWLHHVYYYANFYKLLHDIQAGYKEREDRIAELEEFINDQVTELDKMEATMKQTVSSKQLLEKDYQKLNEYYDTAKVYNNHVNYIYRMARNFRGIKSLLFLRILL